MAEIRNEYGGCSIERCINFERREGYMENMRVVTRESAEETNTELLQSIDKKLDMLLAAQTATQAAKEE